MGTFKVTTAPNAINAVCEGMFTQADAKAYVDTFRKEAAKVNPATCHLMLDGSKLAVSPQEMQEMLKGVFALYKSMGFNNVTMKLGNNALLKMQISRLAKESGLSNFNMS